MKEKNNKPAQWHSNISQIEQNFYFHSLIKYANTTQHYIVEDIQNFMKQFGVENQVLYYLKQIFFTDKKEFEFQVKYYNDLQNYCQNLSIRRKDVCKLLKYFVHQDDSKSQYEIVLIMEYGEADRIDVDQIENSHINKFLKNIIGLLQDIKKYSEIGHGNLDIQNIILVQDILKISGFKPIYPEGSSSGWKGQIIKEYGRERLDLFLLGLLWLQFKKFSINELTKSTNSKKLVFQNIKSTFLDQIDSLRNIEGKEILKKLLDLQNYPQFDLQQLQLLFDTILILKDIQNKDDEDLNPFKESLKSEYVNSSNLNESQVKNKMVINKDFSLKADIVANFKKHHKDELISIQDFNDTEPVEIYNEENQVKENNLRMSVTNQEQPKKYSSQYQSDKQFDSYRDKIQKIKQEVQQKNLQQEPIQEQNSQKLDSQYQQESQEINPQINLEESYKESLVNFSLDQQSQQKDKELLSKNNSSGVFQLQSQESKQFGNLQSKQKNDKNQDNDKPQKRSSTEQVFAYLDTDNKKQSNKHVQNIYEQNGIIEEKDESKFESIKPSVQEEDHLDILQKFNKTDVVVQDSNNQNDQKKEQKKKKKKKNDQNKQNNWDKIKDKIQEEDKGSRLYELVQKAQNKKKESVEQLEKQNEINQQDDQPLQKVEDKNITQNQKKKNSYQNMFMKNQKKKKTKSKKQKQQNYTNTLSKATENKKSYKNLYGYKNESKNKQDTNLDNKIQKVLKKHQAKMLKNQRILKKDDKLDKSLERVKRQKYGTTSNNSQSKPKQLKPNQKIKQLVKQSKVSNINDHDAFLNQTKTFEDINKKLFQSIPNQKPNEMPLTKRREVQNDYKSIRPMKQQKIPNLPAEQNPLVKGLPDIKQKDKLDKSSFDIKFDISLNKSRNYDSYIDCKYKTNNYRSRSKNLPTDNILQDVYQKQNTIPNETLNFSFDNSFANTMQDHNKTIENIMQKFDNKQVNTSQMSQSKKPKKKAQFNLGEVQRLLNNTLMKKKNGEDDQKSQKQSPNQSMNKSLNRSVNKSLNRSMNKSLNRSMNKSINKNQNRGRNKSYIKEKETIQDKLKNDPEFLELQYGRNYQQKMKTLAVLLKHQKLEEAIELLFYVLQTEIGQAKVDAYKQLGILFCYTNDLDKAVEYTIRGIEYQDNQNLKEDYIDNKKALLMNLAITYSRRKEFDNCLDILMDDLFQNEQNQPIAYMTILGDCHYSMKSYLNAFECYKEQIERLCQLLLNKDVYHNFILVSKKAVASLIEGEEYQFFPEFLKFVIKCGKRFTATQETYEGKAKFTKLQDKLICALIHIIWSKRSTKFMLHIMKQQTDKKLINLSNLSPKEVNILVDDILSYALDLKKSDQFKKFRNDFYLANDYILKAINSVKNQSPLSRQKVITLFNQGIFLIQERNFQLAKKHHQECLDILNSKDMKNEQQIFVILYNIGLSMYKMNDEKNCIYYLEQIYERKCNNKQILSQSLYLLILSYFKTSQYEKIIQYFENDLSERYGVNSDLEYEHLQMMLFLYFFANYRVRSGSLKKTLLNYQERLKQNNDDLLYHIVLANSKLMLKYFRGKKLKNNIPLQEKLNHLLTKDQKNIDALMRLAKDFYFQQVEQVPIGQDIAQYGVKTQANFIASFILQMINLLNFSCSREYTLEQRREVIKYITDIAKNEDFTSKIFSQSINYNTNLNTKHDLSFINEEISKLDTTQNFETTQRLNQTNNIKTKNQPKKIINLPVQKKEVKKQKKSIEKVQKNEQSTEDVFNNLQNDQNFEKLWLCASKEKLDSIKDFIVESCQKNVSHTDKKKALIKLILTNKMKQNEKQIVAGIKKLKLHKMNLKDFLEVAQALLITQDNHNLRAFLIRIQREQKEYFPKVIQSINNKFLQNYNQIILNIKRQIFNEKQFYIENTVFYHLLSEDFRPQKAFLILTEELSILMINFFKCIKLKSFNFVKELIHPDIIEKYKVFNVVYQYFVKDKMQEQIKYINKMIDLASNVESNEFQNNIFIVYLLLNYCHTQNISEVQIIDKLRKLFEIEDLNQEQTYMFVIMTSLIGNVYFRKKMWMKSNKLKQLSFEGFKRLDIQNLQNLQLQDFPIYSKEYLLFQIFSFWYMNEHNLSSSDLSKRCLSSMEKFNFSDEDLKNQFMILKLYEKKFTDAGLENQEMIQLQDDGIVNKILNDVQRLLVD